jgi:hypothetical protein
VDDDEHTTLGRIDERVKSLHATLSRIEDDMEKFVELVRFLPVERLVYGLVAIILAAVVAAMIALVLRR